MHLLAAARCANGTLHQAVHTHTHTHIDGWMDAPIYIRVRERMKHGIGVPTMHCNAQCEKPRHAAPRHAMQTTDTKNLPSLVRCLIHSSALPAALPYC